MTSPYSGTPRFANSYELEHVIDPKGEVLRDSECANVRLYFRLLGEHFETPVHHVVLDDRIQWGVCLRSSELIGGWRYADKVSALDPTALFSELQSMPPADVPARLAADVRRGLWAVLAEVRDEVRARAARRDTRMAARAVRVTHEGNSQTH